MYRFFVSLKHESGGFRMHDDGEVDVRGTYTVIAIASLLNILTPELSRGVADFAVSPVLSCPALRWMILNAGVSPFIVFQSWDLH